MPTNTRHRPRVRVQYTAVFVGRVLIDGAYLLGGGVSECMG